MQLNKNDFEKEISKLNETVRAHYVKDRNKMEKKTESDFIYDGVINVDEYIKPRPNRILWILKEPYGWDKGYSYLKNLDEKRAIGENREAYQTFDPIIYVSYGILNSYMKYDTMIKLDLNKELSKVLRKIAIIQVNKMPRYTTFEKKRAEKNIRTDMNDLKKCYDDNKHILHEQIKVYRPDIVIGANTLQFFKNDKDFNKDIINLKIDGEQRNIGHFKRGNTLFIKTYHPSSQRKNSKKYIDYIDNIITRVEQFYNGKLIPIQ
ncbi:MAG: hypothetical protein JST29_11470 [Bacteroidetes bacterium]|nr:hypothetical protein [Bacteroidota bacterium]